MVMALNAPINLPANAPYPYAYPTFTRESAGYECIGPAFSPTNNGLKTPASSFYADTTLHEIKGFFGDFFNRVYVDPAAMSLIDPATNVPIQFRFWNAGFVPVQIVSLTAQDATGLTIGPAFPITIGALSLGIATIQVGSDAPGSEQAEFVFTTASGLTTTWKVLLLRTNSLPVAPESLITETLRWKTDVMAARDGTEQRTTLTQFARVEHNIKYLMTEDQDYQQFYKQLVTQGAGSFTYPIWNERIRLSQTANQSVISIFVDLTMYDLQAGDQLLFSNADQTIIESAKIDFIGTDQMTVVLLSALKNTWTSDDLLFRVTTCVLPAKPQIERGPFGYVEVSAVLKVTEFRDLFAPSIVTQEIVQADLLPDRVLTNTVYTLQGVPILHGRPVITDGNLKDTVDWDIEVIDYDTGTLNYFSDRILGQVTVDRKFYIKNLTQKFYWNWIMNWCHGQRRPVWVPTWENDIGLEVLNMAGSTITTIDETFNTFYGTAVTSAHCALWFTDPTSGLFFARKITAVGIDGFGHTVISLDKAFPTNFETGGSYDVGFLMLSRQATDEVQWEWYPFYSFLTTSFIGTKATPEVT